METGEALGPAQRLGELAIGKLDVLVATTAPSGSQLSIIASSSCLTAWSSTTVSIAAPAPANGAAPRGAPRTALPASRVAVCAAALTLAGFVR
jgi:hypothetical protein